MECVHRISKHGYLWIINQFSILLSMVLHSLIRKTIASPLVASTTGGVASLGFLNPNLRNGRKLGYGLYDLTSQAIVILQEHTGYNMSCKKSLFCRFLCSEFHYSKFCFSHHDWKSFAYTPWLPHKWQFQVLFLIYRWVFALYFLGWLIDSGVQTEGPKFFIFLTIWALIAWVLYLLFAAASVTFRFFQVHVVCWEKFEIDSSLVESEPAAIEKPKGCCGAKTDRITWYQKIQWSLFNVGTEIAFVVLILYWSLLYRGGEISGTNANTHLTNGLIALVDLWVSGTPVQLLHFIYLQALGVTYAVFTGIYYVADGTNFRGQPYIYPVLNYENGTALAVGINVGVVLVLLPAIHLFWYLQFAARFWLVWFIYRKCRKQAYTVEQPMGVKQASTAEKQPMDVEISWMS